MGVEKETTSAQQRKRMQNRAAQKTYREFLGPLVCYLALTHIGGVLGEKLKKRIEDLERWRDVALAVTGRTNDSKPNGNEQITDLTPESSGDTQTDVDIDNILASAWSAQPTDNSGNTAPPSGFSLHEQINLIGNSQMTSATLDFGLMEDITSVGRKDNTYCPVTLMSPVTSTESDSGRRDSASRQRAGKTALHIAAECDHVGVLRVLLQRMPDPNVRDSQGRTAMHLAVENQCYNTAKALIEFHDPEGTTQKAGHAIDVNAQDNSGQSALHLASMSGGLAMVKLLSCAPQIVMDVRDGEGFSPLHRASLLGHDGIVEELIKRGADYNLAVS